jgi:hypothetical protein
MLTDPQLRSKIDALWDKLWSGGLSNPLDAIEQLSFLSRYRQVEQEEVFYEQPAVTLYRMRQLEQVAESDVFARAAMLAKTSGQT